MKDYPKQGGKGVPPYNACDEYPPVDGADSIKGEDGCNCPPPYPHTAKAMAALNFIPFVGQILSSTVGQVKVCADLLADRKEKYQKAQEDFEEQANRNFDEMNEIVLTIGDVIKQPEGASKATGILPDTLDLLLAYSRHTSMYLTVIGVAVGLVLLGVVLTM
jgi:hypothetical protein